MHAHQVRQEVLLRCNRCKRSLVAHDVLQGLSHSMVEHKYRLVLVGDSDMERWPSSLLPRLPWPHATENGVAHSSVERCFRDCTVHARSGATMSQVADELAQELSSFPKSGDTQSQQQDVERCIIVGCAGENDIGIGKSVEAIAKDFERLLDIVFLLNAEEQLRNEAIIHHQRFLVFLGPKLEPWLVNDSSSQKKYVKLSRLMRRACDRHPHREKITFVECITMFCGKSATLTGAISAGRATADVVYFCDDGLHLNDSGYIVWRKAVEEAMLSIGAVSDANLVL